jgi:sporulation protein YqfC
MYIRGGENMPNKKETPKKQFAKPEWIENLVDDLEVSQEAISELPIITMLGDHEISIENFYGIATYEPERIQIKIQDGRLEILGAKLLAKSMTTDKITIRGQITSISFIG